MGRALIGSLTVWKRTGGAKAEGKEMMILCKETRFGENRRGDQRRTERKGRLRCTSYNPLQEELWYENKCGACGGRSDLTEKDQCSLVR